MLWELIGECEVAGFTLELSDIMIVDGELEIDGMPADQWVDAMTMD